MPKPFLVFSWNKPFLPEIKKLAAKECHAAHHIPTIITPTFRLWRHLKESFTADKKAVILPRMLPMKELMSIWHASIQEEPAEEASVYDKIVLLHNVAKNSTATDFDSGEEVQVLQNMGLDAFIPWGEQLTALIDEILANGLVPDDLAVSPEDKEVSEAVVHLLSALGSISSSYLEELEKQHLTTYGLMAQAVLESIEDGQPIPSTLQPGAERPFFILVETVPCRAELAMLRALWNAGAQICLHTDPAMANENQRGIHWSTQHIARWINEWQAEVMPGTASVLEEGKSANFRKGRKTRFFAGYDLHSQLAALQGHLEADMQEAEAKADQAGKSAAAGQKKPSGKEGRAAIVLPSSSMLMPLLHHIPDKLRSSLEVAMGLTIRETALCQLIAACLDLQGMLDEAGRFHWKKLVDCLDTPVLGFLSMKDGSSLQPALRRCRSQLLLGRRFVDPFEDVLRNDCFAGREDETEALEELLTVLTKGFGHLASLEDLACALKELCNYFRKHAEVLREKSPLDMEALFHLENSIIPSLSSCLMKDEKVSLATITRIFNALCSQEHIAFAPRKDASAGDVVIIDLAQTALLSFDHLYLPEATDDMLPGPRKRDLLLPESLRAVIGLPPLSELEDATSCRVMRLCQSSGTVSFYWQEGVSKSTLLDGKKTRSRYVEEYIWQMEKEEGRLFKSGTAPLTQADSRLVPLNADKRSIPCEGIVREALDARLKGALSPSSLDVYLHCPLQFAYRKLARLNAPDEVNEKDDPMKVGEFIHKVLEIFHRKHLGECMPAEDDRPRRNELKRELAALFASQLEDDANPLSSLLPPESFSILREAGQRKLASYIDAMPGGTCPILLEHDLTGHIEAAGSSFRLTGRLDRLDRRDGKLIILDYKTGKALPDCTPDLWTDENFFAEAEELASLKHPDARDRKRLDELFAFLSQNAKSIQLPTYIAMGLAGHKQVKDNHCGQQASWPEGDLSDAAFIALAKGGWEQSFFKKPAGLRNEDEIKQKQAEALHRCPTLVKLVLAHMKHAETFLQMKNDFCTNCDYLPLCTSCLAH